MTFDPTQVSYIVPVNFKRTKRLLIPSILYLLCFLDLGFSQATGSRQALTPRVDERVELLSIVFRLAGNGEYNMDSLPSYSAEIDRDFAPYKTHPAVQWARNLADKNGVGFDAVMAMAVSISPPPELKPLVTFGSDVPDARWGDGSDKFLVLLRDFYRDSKFASFFGAHRPFYRLAEERFTTLLEALDIGWYSRFYGKAPELAYHLILGMNNGGGNYGPRLAYPDGHRELFSIIGCWTHDDAGNPTYPSDQGYLSTIVHEFNHSFVNPAVAEHWKDFSDIQPVYASVAERMKNMAYGNAETMVNESLVRAAVVMYFQQRGEDARANLHRIRKEQGLGFYWMDRLVEKLKQYGAERERYPTFSSYIPQIAAFYRELSSHVASEAAAFDAKCAHVVKTEPFANHAQDVDSSTKTLSIVLDKPLDTKGGYSINAGMDGSEHYPISGKPQYSSDGLRIQLPLELKANQTYSFVLTGLAFGTPSGYPLVSYKVEFKTK